MICICISYQCNFNRGEKKLCIHISFQGNGDGILGVWEWENGEPVLDEVVGADFISGKRSIININNCNK